mgnify:CR=1 FL=1
MKELIDIQRRLKAPKSQRNTFANYNFRSTEDILEALKPLLAENECYLCLSDEVRQIGERYYVYAEATIFNSTGESVRTQAYAREAEDKKGMDASQVTGMASSYARKYALNGLFAIDDNKDADSLPSKEEIDTATEKAKKASTVDELTVVWRDFPGLRTNETFKKAVAIRTKELRNETPQSNEKTKTPREQSLL